MLFRSKGVPQTAGEEGRTRVRKSGENVREKTRERVERERDIVGGGRGEEREKERERAE